MEEFEKLTDLDKKNYFSNFLNKKVFKNSKKPFKSGEKINTVNNIVVMNTLSTIRKRKVYGFSFLEDDSVVECLRCKLYNPDLHIF